MTDEKPFARPDDSGGEGGKGASRARNRTVMLTPEITGEVRARLAQDLTPEPHPEVSPGVSEASSQLFGQASVQQPQQPAAPSPVTAAPVAPPQPQAIPASGDAVVWSRPAPVTGFLVSFDRDENGQVFELRAGRLIVTSESPGSGNFLVLDDQSVSPMHAIIRVSADGEIQILDQLSEFGTRILRSRTDEEEDLSGEKSDLFHGDLVYFGERSFYVCLVPRRDG